MSIELFSCRRIFPYNLLLYDIGEEEEEEGEDEEEEEVAIT